MIQAYAASLPGIIIHGFEARFKLWFRVIKKMINKHSNPEETEEVVTSGSKDASSSSTLIKAVRIEPRPCSKSFNSLV